MPTRMSPLRSAMQKQTRSLVWGARSGVYVPSSTAMVCRSAVHHGKRGLNGGRSSNAMESMDGGTSTPYSRFVGMKTQSRRPSSAVLGVLMAVGAAAIFSTAGVIVRRIDLPAWDVSFWRSILLLITVLPLVVWQWRKSWIDIV